MSTAEHEHKHEDRPFDWFSALDVLVWAAVFLIVVLAAEWAYGAFVRARIARGASRYLATVDAESTTE